MAETIVFGGQKLDIDENDPLWKQLIEKYAKKKTGWEEPEKHSKAYMIHSGLLDGTNRIDGFYRYEDNIDANAWKRAAVFEYENFCRMQARAEEIRRKLLRFVAENDKPCAQRCNRYTISYNYVGDCLQINVWSQSPPIFEPAFETRECAERAMMEFAEDLFWVAREYKPRLDQEV